MAEIINLSSDTQTLPTNEMYEAMRTAPLGDDMTGDDPTVNRFEKLAAEKVGKEAALLVVSGTMGNLVSLMAHASPGDEVIVDAEAHIYFYEAGSMANIGGLMPKVIPSRRGMLDPADVIAAVRPRDQHYPVSRVLCLENTHNRSGGRVIPLDLHEQLCAAAKKHDLAVHLDGARIFDAAIAAGVPVTAFTKHVDSLMFCLSKGLSCPIGSVIAGSAEFIDRARLVRKRIGGAMRQAGIIAACGVVALETMVDRLADDHAHAKTLAQGIAELPGLTVDLDTVESNMVYVDHTGTGLTTSEFLAKLKGSGVLASDRAPTHIRFVPNRHHDDDDIEETLSRIRGALGVA